MPRRIRRPWPRSRGWSERALALAIALLVAVAFGLGSSPAGADQAPVANGSSATCSAVRLVVGNPQPGDLLVPGTYVIQGSATDPPAGQAPGVDRVQVFFDQPRESGGRLVGQVQAGEIGPTQHLTASDFALLALLPDTSAPNNTHSLFVYARSASSGQEQLVSFQVQMKFPLGVGNALTPTPTPPAASVLPPPCGSPTPTPTFPPFPVGIAAATPGPSDSLTLRVSNPQPGDTISRGLYVIQGLAFDASAQQGTGIDQVAVFLDPRDQGGQLLGIASMSPDGGAGGPFGFELVASLPDRGGGHTLSVYARSAVSGRETSVSVPITIR